MASQLNLAVLRLASELKLDKCTRQYQGETEKLLWDCHKAELEYIEVLSDYLKLLQKADVTYRASSFRGQLQEARCKLDGNQVHLEIVQKLVHQLEGRSQNFLINVEQLKQEKGMAKMDGYIDPPYLVEAIDHLRTQGHELRGHIDQLQDTITLCSDETIKATSDLIHDVISK